MLKRTKYLEKLKQCKDKKIIKVIKGIHRCGKSTLLKLFQEYIKEEGILEEQIISLNFEALENEDLLDYKVLYQYITSNLCNDKTTYIFLDEIQKVKDFEKVVDSLYIKENIDIYITGSNAYMLSGELATLLSGRYIEISMLPLSFSEYCKIREVENIDKLFYEFIQYEGFPYTASIGMNKENIDLYIEGIYNTIIIKDIEDRQIRRDNKRKISDMFLLRTIAKFLASSVGNPISIKSISDYITSTGRKISQNTVSDYIEVLTESFIFYPVEHFDILGKQLMKMNQKIYIVDLDLRRYLLPRKDYDLGFSLENMVFLELLRRGYSVNIGKLGNTEVDFVARKNDRIYYFQVTASMIDENTFKREITPLKNIKDNYPKTILTLDRFTIGNYEGIEVINAIDWLLDK